MSGLSHPLVRGFEALGFGFEGLWGGLGVWGQGVEAFRPGSIGLLVVVQECCGV